MPLKILSDFDGVWTDQILEAECVKSFLIAEVARLTGASEAELAAPIAAIEEHVLREPHRYGWAPDGRITAFVDEDPLCVSNGIVSYIADEQDERAAQFRDAILAGGFESLAAFGDHCFQGGIRTFREQHGTALIPGAEDIVAVLRETGADVVIVSNSPNEKIISWFATVGVEVRADASADLRVIGNAGKQLLSDTGETVKLGGRNVYVDRPAYRAILERERPDVLIGDVFCIDHATPCVMRAAGELPGISLVLRKHRFTPDWTLGLLAEGILDHAVASVGDLPELVGRSVGT